MFEETQLLTKQKALAIGTSSPPNVPHSVSATQPTSAMAAHIAISAPAAAVRAASIDHGGAIPPKRVGTPGINQDRSSDAGDFEVTARLRAAEEMRKAQRAHINAQNESARRGTPEPSTMTVQQQIVSRMLSAGILLTPAGQLTMPPSQTRTVVLPGRAEVQMTQEQIQQHLLAQAQTQVHSQTLVYPPHLLHPQGVPAHHPGATLGMALRHTSSAPSPQQNFGLGIDLAASPPSDNTSHGKRGLEPSPIGAATKRAKLDGRRPSECLSFAQRRR